MNLITKYRIPVSFIKCIKYLKMKDVFDPTNEDGSSFHEKIMYLAPAERMGEEVSVSYTHLTLPTKRIV